MPYGWIFAYIIGNICMSAVAMSLRWVNRGLWASCYDKHDIVYFFHSEYADSSEPQWEHKLFAWNLVSEYLLFVCVEVLWLI